VSPAPLDLEVEGAEGHGIDPGALREVRNERTNTEKSK